MSYQTHATFGEMIDREKGVCNCRIFMKLVIPSSKSWLKSLSVDSVMCISDGLTSLSPCSPHFEMCLSGKLFTLSCGAESVFLSTGHCALRSDAEALAECNPQELDSVTFTPPSSTTTPASLPSTTTIHMTGGYWSTSLIRRTSNLFLCNWLADLISIDLNIDYFAWNSMNFTLTLIWFEKDKCVHERLVSLTWNYLCSSFESNTLIIIISTIWIEFQVLPT